MSNLRIEEWIKESYFKKKFYQHLREFYIKYNLNWVENLVNDLYSSLSSKEIKNKYNTIVEFGYSEKDRLVLNADFNLETKNYFISLNKTIIENSNEDDIKEDLIKEIQFNLMHEDTHRQQNQGNLKYQKLPNLSKITTKKYLSHYTEIDARAREISYWLKQNGNDLDKSLEKIQKNIDTGPHKDTIKWYHEIGGSVYHKFLSEIYRFFVGED
jgi:hypothetical protein